MKMSNRWNRFIYRLWAPVYDAVLEGLFRPGRARALACLALQPGERMLLVGVGTGSDLEYLPHGVEALGLDISPEMLRRARAKLPLTGRLVSLVEGDAQQLLVEEGSFDALIFNLILSVIPDGRACLQENLRALKPGGRAVVFDKFLPDGEKNTPARRFLNVFSTQGGTDITRRFGDIASGADCKIISNQPGILRGMYRVILLRRN